jgi:hypothetical protein
MPAETESIGFSGKGGTVSISTDGGTTYTEIKQVKDVKPSGSKANYDNITNLSSPGNAEEFIPLTVNSGTVTLTVISNPLDAGQTALLAAFQAQTKLKVEVQYPTVGTQTTGLLKTFSAYVSSVPMPSMGVSNASTFDAELTISGLITDTPGTTA